MSDSSEPGSRQKIIDDLHRDLGGATNQEQLQTKLSSSDKNVKRSIQEYIVRKRLLERLSDENWITPEQYDEIKGIAETLGYGGKRRYSTRSKKYKKSNKRSKRTRTLRRKRYSRKS